MKSRINAHKRASMRRCGHAARRTDCIAPADTARELLRVLIVDDHRANADTLSLLVAKLGTRCPSCLRRRYGFGAGRRISAGRAAARHVDAGGEWFRSGKQVRRQDRLKHCFIIAVTGRTDAKHRSRCYEAGVDLFLISRSLLQYANAADLGIGARACAKKRKPTAFSNGQQ